MLHAALLASTIGDNEPHTEAQRHRNDKDTKLVYVITLTAEIRVVASHEGGRKSPFFSGYRPQFYFDGEDYDSTLNCHPKDKSVSPGDIACVELTLSEFASTALQSRVNTGSSFELREGRRVVARGKVIRVADAH